MDHADVAARRDANAAQGLDLADLDPDPIVQFQRWFDDVLAAELPEPTAMVLVTAPAGDGAQPLGRHVLLRSADHRGFTWVTNFESRKGQHLAANPRAALVFPWFPLGRQVVVQGAVAPTPDDESDAYWATRPPESRLASAASPQSEPIADRAWLETRYAELAARYPDGDIPRPAHWGGYRLAPTSVELWQGRAARLHDRFRYERDDVSSPWRVTRLAP